MCSKSNYTKLENKSPLDNHVCVRKFLNYRQLKAERLCHGKGHSVLFSSQSFPKQLLLGTVRDRSRRTFGLVQYSCSLVPLFLFYSSNKVYFYSSPQNCGQHTGKDFTRNPDFCDFSWYSQGCFFSFFVCTGQLCQRHSLSSPAKDAEMPCNQEAIYSWASVIIQ